MFVHGNTNMVRWLLQLLISWWVDKAQTSDVEHFLSATPRPKYPDGRLYFDLKFLTTWFAFFFWYMCRPTMVSKVCRSKSSHADVISWSWWYLPWEVPSVHAQIRLCGATPHFLSRDLGFQFLENVSYLIFVSCVKSFPCASQTW